MARNRERGIPRERSLITLTNPRSPVSEAFRVLRTNLQFASLDQPIRSLMVTSSGPEEGKSTTTANLAVTLAQAEQRVLLIDADLRKPSQHHIFRLPNTVGLMSVLLGRVALQEAAQRMPSSSLSVLSSGPIPPNPAEVLASRQMDKFLEEAGKEYDWLLIDTPPVVAVTDAQILAGKVDGVLLVVQAGRTHRDMVQKAKGLLDNVKAPLLGAVLNQKRFKGQEYYYYYYGEKGQTS